MVRGVPSLFTPKIAEFVMYTFEALGIHTLIFPRLIKGYSLLATIILFVCGYHDITIERLLQILQFAPSGSSVKTLLHYLQCHRSQKLKPYEEFDMTDMPLPDEMVKKEILIEEEISRNSESEYSDDGYKSAQSSSSESTFHDNNLMNMKTGSRIQYSSQDLESVETFQMPDENDIYSLNRVFIPISIWWAEADWAASKSNISKIVRELPNVVNCWKLPKPTCGHLDFLWGRTGNFYQELNRHLDDTYPNDWEELEKQLNYVHGNMDPENSKDNALHWYICAMSANVRFSYHKIADMVGTHLSSVNFF